MDTPFGIYIHIPFCKSKCYYCDFVSFCDKDDYIDSYFNALIKEIKLKKNILRDKEVDTIYIGGGTPSVVDDRYIEKLLDYIKNNFNIKKDAEITIEVNPQTIDQNKAKAYKAYGINRVSVGLQAVQDNLLKKIGRIHSFSDFKKTYDILKKIGFDNINVDLMFSLPSQSIDDLIKSVEYVTDLDITHISLYSMILEEGTKLYEVYQKNNMTPDDELDRKMYYIAREILEKKGFYQYEISNFAKKGFMSKHNYNCWNYEEFIGFGLNAGSFYNDIILKNTSDLELYINNLKENKSVVEETNELSNREKIENYIMLSLRKNEGIDIEKINDRFGINFLKEFEKTIDDLKKEKLIEIKEGKIKLTYKGMDFSNYVIEEFFEE